MASALFLVAPAVVECGITQLDFSAPGTGNLFVQDVQLSEVIPGAGRIPLDPLHLAVELSIPLPLPLPIHGSHPGECAGSLWSVAPHWRGWDPREGILPGNGREEMEEAEFPCWEMPFPCGKWAGSL